MSEATQTDGDTKSRGVSIEARVGRSWIVPALIGLLSWCLVELSESVILERERSSHLANLDRSILEWQLHLRRPWLNGLFVEITAMGSMTVLAIFTAVFATVSAWRGDRRGTRTIAFTWASSTLLTMVTKHLLARPRPSEIPYLVDVVGYSYPSGHTLGATSVYLTSALIAARWLPQRSRRTATVGAAFALAVTIGASRVYLGVHYPTDVLAGLLLGSVWSLLTLSWIRWRDGWDERLRRLDSATAGLGEHP